MPDINIASGGGGGGKYVIFTDYCFYVPRVVAMVVVLKLNDKLEKEGSSVSVGTQKTAVIRSFPHAWIFF